MDARSIRVYAPRFDSTKPDEFQTWSTDFQSYVEYQGGDRLVELAMIASGDAAVAATLVSRSAPQQVVNAIPLGAGGEAQDPNADEAAPLNNVGDLTADERRLDKQFYHLLKLHISGPGHDMILHVQSKSFVEAFAILQNEYGAANCLRKSALISQLFDLNYDGKIDDFKQKTLSLLRSIFQASIKIEDIIMSCLLNAFNSEEFQAFKLLTAKQIDSGEDINLYDFVQSIANSVELSSQSRSRTNTSLRVEGSPSCTRCGQDSHDRNQCYAKKHKDGTELNDRPPASKPNGRKGKGRGKGKGKGGKGNQGNAKLSDLLRDITGGVSPSLDQLKTAVAKATSLRIKGAPVVINDPNVPDDRADINDAFNEPSVEFSNGLSEVRDTRSEEHTSLARFDPEQERQAHEHPAVIKQMLCALVTASCGHAHTRRNSGVVLDSGSQCHLFEGADIQDPNALTLVSGFSGSGSVLSEGKGTVDLLTTDTDENRYTLNVDDVDSMKHLPQDILSLAKLVLKHKCKFIATEDGSLLITPDGTQIPIIIENGVFILPRFDEANCNYVRSNQERIDWRMLHARLGHASAQVMINTLNNTFGLAVAAKDIGDFFCHVCALTKSARQRISSLRNPDTQATRPFECIHADIKSFPDSALSRQGFRYYVIYVCTLTDWIDIFGLKRKNDCTSTVAELALRHGLDKSTYPITIVSDGDGSFQSPFTVACAAEGIRHEFTPPHTPQHNRAERAILSIDTMARTALVDAPYLEFAVYYQDASDYATYVHNRTVGIRGKTPFELTQGKQPMIKHLRPFGCQGFLHAPKGKRPDLPAGHRAQEVHLLGYRSPISNQWKVLIMETKRTVFSIHVDWNEQDFGIQKMLSADHLEAILDDAGIARDKTAPAANIESPVVMIEKLKSPELSEVKVPDQDFSKSGVDSETDQSGQAGAPGEDDVTDAAPPEDSTASPEALTIPRYYGHNEAISEINPANIIDGRRCNHTTVITLASSHRAVKEHMMRDVMNAPDAELWLAAIDKEIDAILARTAVFIGGNHRLYEEAVKNATRSRICLTEKRDGRKKARWIVQGCFEDHSYDDFSNYAHVASLVAFRALIFRHDRRHRTLGAIDITTAFLQSDKYGAHEARRYISLKNPRTGTLEFFLLNTPMYGQRSAPIRWENTLAPWLETQGLVRGKNESCAYYRAKDDLTVLLYVDDLLVDGDKAAVDQFFTTLAERFQVTAPVFLTAETPIDFLGVIITLDENYVSLTMEDYHNKLLSNMGMTGVKPIGTPITVKIEESEALSDANASLYRSGVGGIGWLANTVRPDMAYVFSRLGQHLATPTVASLAALHHALRYVSGTTSAGIRMALSAASMTTDVFDFFSDSDHAGNSEAQNARRSQSGHIGRQNGTPVRWYSGSQTITTISSTEAEIFAASVATQSFMHLSFLISELGIRGFPSPFQLYVDNNAAIIFMQDTASVSRLKHIDCRLNWVLQMRDRNIVVPCSVASAENLADIFTKILAGPVFRRLAEQMMFFRP